MVELKIVLLFIFVTSIIYCLKYVVDLFIIMKSDDPEPLTISPINKILLLLSSSYIITYILSLILY